MHPVNRRRFIKQITLASAALPWISRSAESSVFTPLRDIARRQGLDFGFALNATCLAQDPLYRRVVAQQANIVVPENALKWSVVHPAAQHFNFAPADQIASFAASHAQRMRGHTFCWHREIPDWVLRTATPTNAAAILDTHIETVAKHYRGKIHSWDVVNEAIQLQDGLPQGLRNSFWYQMLGPRYLDLAYHTAHQADPQALLCYNDYGLESDAAASESKREAVFLQLKSMLQRKVPIHALGIQSHLRASDPFGFGPGLVKFMLRVRDLGLLIYITELDVDDSLLSGSNDRHDSLVASTYKRYLDLVLGCGAVSSLVSWGVWDTPHQTGATPQQGPAARRALIFGPQGTLKPASWVLAHSLARAQPSSYQRQPRPSLKPDAPR